MGISDFFTVICALLGVIGLLFLTYYAVRWLNKRSHGVGFGGGKNKIQIIECLGIAQDKQLLAIKAGKKAMLLGVAPNSVTKLCDLDEDDVAIMEQQDEESEGGFAESLKKAFSGNKSSKQEVSCGQDDKSDI